MAFSRFPTALAAVTSFLACHTTLWAAEDFFADLADGTPRAATISDGPLRGYVAEGVASYLGIPYAAPPEGDLRWMPPAEPEPWSTPLDASSFGDACVQTQTYGVFAVESTSEDCLYLNVFAPEKTSEEPRPVMVWIHGGGLVNGRSDDYDARRLASEGGVVVVTLNYRLNLMGYFAHPDIDAEGHPFGNYGTLDQQAALRWVRDEIAVFGGDPQNVTLFGESAGGLAVLFNMVSPDAEGLFHKAILQSGVSASGQTSLEAAEEYGRGVEEALGCTDAEDVPACMRGKSVDQIIAAGSPTDRSTRVVDGKILPAQMQELMADGAFHRVPILMGNNKDEWTWFVGLSELASGTPLTAENYEASFVSRFGEEAAARIVAEYPLEEFASPSLAAATAGTAGNFVCPSRQVMASAEEHVPVYVYEFVDGTAPYYFPNVSFPYGAAHTLELQYLFPRYHGAAGEPQDLTGAQSDLSAAMIAYWTRFAATGVPSSPGQPSWPRWSKGAPQVLLLDPEGIAAAADSGIDRKCGFWAELP